MTKSQITIEYSTKHGNPDTSIAMAKELVLRLQNEGHKVTLAQQYGGSCSMDFGGCSLLPKDGGV